MTEATLRRRVLQRDRFTCRTCGGKADTVEPIFPHLKTTQSNLRSVCFECHASGGER